MSKIKKIFILLAIFTFVSILAKQCEQKIFDDNLAIYQCQNCGLVSEALNCYQTCLESEQQLYYSGVLNKCVLYQGEGQILSDSEIYCVDGFTRDLTSKKCTQKLTCPEGMFNQDLNLILCLNCYLVSDIKYCNPNQIQKLCKYMQYYSGNYCFHNCGNGLIISSIADFDCQNGGQNCIKGFKWNSLQKKCIKCNEVLINEYFKIYQCRNCSYVSDLALCNNNCYPDQYFSKENQNCINTNLDELQRGIAGGDCVDGFHQNQFIQCEKNCNQALIDPNFNLYQCENCSLTQEQNKNNCSKQCLKSQIYLSSSDNCFNYCGYGLVASQIVYCESSSFCIDGYLWNSSEQKCIKCNNNIFDINFDLYVTQSCELYSKGEEINIICGHSYYRMVQMKNKKCMKYCRNGLVAEQNQDCLSSTICVSGFSYNYQTNRCEKCQKSLISSIYSIYQCQNCGLTSYFQYCQCLTSQYFSYKLAQCTYYCDKGIIALNKNQCNSSQECVDGFKYNLQTQICEKIACNESVFDSNLNLYKCQNCSLVTNLEHCKLNENLCQDLQYFNFQSQTCKPYCKNGIISLDSCSLESLEQFDCIDGFKLNNEKNRCLKICLSDNFDNNLTNCENCDLVSTTQPTYCGQCKSNEFYSSNLNQCMTYCGKGIIAKDNSICPLSNTCIDNYQWNSSTQKCQICTEHLIDSYLNLIQCKNCSITSQNSPCSNLCRKSEYYSQKKNGQCMLLCGSDGSISENQTSCGISNQCVDGFMWDKIINKCKKQCNQVIVNTAFIIYQCSNCILTSDTQLCSNTCSNSEYFSQLLNKCMKMCSDGKVAETQELCKNSNYCVDGFQWNFSTKGCEYQHTCTQGTIDPILKIYQCSNCSLVTNYDFCNNKCLISQFYSSNLNQCMIYCGNGRISIDSSTCPQSNICIDNCQWNSSTEKCEKDICNYSVINTFLNLIQCENCSITSFNAPCINPCKKSEYYSQTKSQCMVLCGSDGLISENQADCAISNWCVDGFMWDNSVNKCKKQFSCNQVIVNSTLNIYQCSNCILVTNTQLCSNNCSNSSYFSQLLNKCMKMCLNGKIAETQELCENSNYCVDGFTWNNSVNKCERQQTCKQVIINSTFNIYQCSNCILVTDTQLCSNTCLISDYFSQLLNKCMKMCSDGKVAETQELCENSNHCVDGFQWNSLTKSCEYQNNCNLFIVDPILKIYQCSNCSLVTNYDFCNNKYLISQFYSSNLNQCMIYCGNGIIAKDTSSCNKSNTCIDGVTYTEPGKCKQHTQSEGQSNQNIQQNQNKDDQSQNINFILIGSLAIFIISIISFLVYKVSKRFQSVFKTQQSQQEKTEELFDQIKETFQDIKSLHEKIDKNNQHEIKSKEIFVNLKSKSQVLIDQPIEEMTLYQIEQNYDNINQQQVQQNLDLEIQESK